jgi:hypothetical protein
MATEERVRVAPHPNGYQVIILGTDIEILVTHEEIKERTYGLVLTLEDLEQWQEWAPNGLVVGLWAAQPAKLPWFHRN